MYIKDIKNHSLLTYNFVVISDKEELCRLHREMTL